MSRPRVTGDGLARARSVLLTVLAVEVAILLVTGIALFFLYRPTVDQAWGDLVTGDYNGSVRLAYATRLVHRLVARLALLTAVAAGIVVALRTAAGTRRGPAVALGAGLALTTVAASFTGFLLPWDQLALWAVTVGTNLRGYRVLFDPVVRFVIIDGVEVGKDTVVRWLLIHALVLGPALAGLVVVARRRHRAEASDDPAVR
jgi:quinol-cytochrome oxidoreductase complex cytochrome b subunit